MKPSHGTGIYSNLDSGEREKAGKSRGSKMKPYKLTKDNGDTKEETRDRGSSLSLIYAAIT